MAWIKQVKIKNAEGLLKTLYKAVITADGHIDNILQVHSLRPRTLKGHLELYKAVLHSKPNALSPRERELVGITVSQLNDCEYCVAHHTAGLARDVGSQALAEELALAAIGEFESSNLTAREKSMCDYTQKLTLTPAAMNEADLKAMREAGLDDSAILDVNQIAAYFAYANRTVNGLGVVTKGEPLGLHPNENEEGFAHR